MFVCIVPKATITTTKLSNFLIYIWKLEKIVYIESNKYWKASDIFYMGIHDFGTYGREISAPWPWLLNKIQI